MENLALSVKEAAASVGAGNTRFYQLLNSGAIRAKKLGKRTIILKADLESYLAGLENYPTQNKDKSVKACIHGDIEAKS